MVINMFDLWAFLLQTLTASGVALLLLVLKALFKDKLSPKWHFAVWSVLGIMILIPAGYNGRYTLFHWQLVVEVIKSCVGDYSVTQVLFPIPILTSIPKTIVQWIFAGYILGVIVHIIKYLVSYIRLRLILRKSFRPSDELIARIHNIADTQKVKIGRVIAVHGLPSAFVCGVIRPVLVIPADSDIDDKVILHEILHMKYKDTLWSIVICFLRCLHWCNPLIIYCADQAINDMEARCDQHVLEQLEGEERRDYGMILLRMANDRFAKTPGSTCINNGGKKICKRIEAIARFKKYPVGMRSVSICVIILLTLSLIVGVQASTVYESNSSSMWLSFASARSTPCTTPAGAFDTYAKAVLDQNGLYRIMCAPEAMQGEIINEISEKEKIGIYPTWDCGLNEWPDKQSGYYIYNLEPCGKNTYEGLLVIKVNYPSNGQVEEEGKTYLAIQNLRAQKESGRWVVTALEDFRNVETTVQRLDWGCPELPGITYSGTAADFRVDVKIQTIYTVENTVKQDNSSYIFGNVTSYFDKTPKPDAEFSQAAETQDAIITHLGSAADRDMIKRLGISAAPVYPGENRPDDMTDPTTSAYESGRSGLNSSWWYNHMTESGWGPTVTLDLGGSQTSEPKQYFNLPEYYAADLYINNELAAELTLDLQKGIEE